MGKYVGITLHNAAQATGRGAIFDVSGAERIFVQLSGTFTATVGFHISADGTDWRSLLMTAANDGSQAITANSPTAWFGDCRGVAFFSVNINSYTDGAVTVMAGSYTTD